MMVYDIINAMSNWSSAAEEADHRVGVGLGGPPVQAVMLMLHLN